MVGERRDVWSAARPGTPPASGIEDGNWDLVANNLGVFFIRDAIKFPDFIHSQKPDPVTFHQEPNRQLDFISQTLESMHMVTLLSSPRGIPASYRHQQGFGVNTYKWLNAAGESGSQWYLTSTSGPRRSSRCGRSGP